MCHLAEYEPIYADRMKRVIALEEPELLKGDPALFAARFAYDERELEEELALIALTRQQMARILRTLKTDDFAANGPSFSRRRADAGKSAGAGYRTHSPPRPIHSGKEACDGDGRLACARLMDKIGFPDASRRGHGILNVWRRSGLRSPLRAQTG